MEASGARILGATLLTLVYGGAAGAQTSAAGRRPVAPEVRADAIVARSSAMHVGFGATVPLGNYLRAGLVAGGGLSRDGASSRIDLIARFHLDPFRESRWAPYMGGGVSARFDADRRSRRYLLVFIGVDGPAGRGVSPSLEAGLGGGARLGVILRKVGAGRR